MSPTLTSSALPGRRSGYLPTLDGWRAIAIAMVLVTHAGLTRFGALGVDLFFAISGILICSRLLDEERLCGQISLRGFYLRRSFRILPAACLFLGIVALLTMIRVLPAEWPAWDSAVLFLRNYFTAFVGDTANNRFTGHFWSLAVEEHFYLLLPGLLLLTPRRKTVLTALILVELAWAAFYVVHTPPAMRQLYWERRSDLRMNSLIFPALLSLLLAAPAFRAKVARVVTPLRVGVVLVAVALGATVAKKVIVPVHPPTQSVAPSNPDDDEAAKNSKLTLATVFVVPFTFPFIILATLLHPETLVSRALEWQPLRAIGRISYSLYLWQQLFWVPTRNMNWPIGILQRHWTALPLVLLCATASYYFVEKPCIRLGHRFAPPVTPGHSEQPRPEKEPETGTASSAGVATSYLP